MDRIETFQDATDALTCAMPARHDDGAIRACGVVAGWELDGHGFCDGHWYSTSIRGVRDGAVPSALADYAARLEMADRGLAPIGGASEDAPMIEYVYDDGGRADAGYSVATDAGRKRLEELEARYVLPCDYWSSLEDVIAGNETPCATPATHLISGDGPSTLACAAHADRWGHIGSSHAEELDLSGKLDQWLRRMVYQTPALTCAPVVGIVDDPRVRAYRASCADHDWSFDGERAACEQAARVHRGEQIARLMSQAKDDAAWLRLQDAREELRAIEELRARGLAPIRGGSTTPFADAATNWSELRVLKDGSWSWIPCACGSDVHSASAHRGASNVSHRHAAIMTWIEAIYRAFGASDLPLAERVAIMNPQRLTGKIERAGVVVWTYDTRKMADIGAPAFERVQDAVDAMRANGARLAPISGGAPDASSFMALNTVAARLRETLESRKRLEDLQSDSAIRKRADRIRQFVDIALATRVEYASVINDAEVKRGVSSRTLTQDIDGVINYLGVGDCAGVDPDALGVYVRRLIETLEDVARVVHGIECRRAQLEEATPEERLERGESCYVDDLWPGLTQRATDAGREWQANRKTRISLFELRNRAASMNPLYPGLPIPDGDQRKRDRDAVEDVLFARLFRGACENWDRRYPEEAEERKLLEDARRETMDRPLRGYPPIGGGASTDVVIEAAIRGDADARRELRRRHIEAWRADHVEEAEERRKSSRGGARLRRHARRAGARSSRRQTRRLIADALEDAGSLEDAQALEELRARGLPPISGGAPESARWIPIGDDPDLWQPEYSGPRGSWRGKVRRFVSCDNCGDYQPSQEPHTMRLCKGCLRPAMIRSI